MKFIERLKSELVKLRVTFQQDKEAAQAQLCVEVAIVTGQRTALETQFVDMTSLQGISAIHMILVRINQHPQQICRHRYGEKLEFTSIGLEIKAHILWLQLLLMVADKYNLDLLK